MVHRINPGNNEFNSGKKIDDQPKKEDGKLVIDFKDSSKKTKALSGRELSENEKEIMEDLLAKDKKCLEWKPAEPRNFKDDKFETMPMPKEMPKDDVVQKIAGDLLGVNKIKYIGNSVSSVVNDEPTTIGQKIVGAMFGAGTLKVISKLFQ